MTTEQILNKAGALAVQKLQSSFDTKGLNDTKKARNSLNHIVKGKTLIISGLARVLFLEFGRKPGQMPPIEPIQKWVESKLGVSSDESKGVAFAIAKKIAKKGTDIFTNRAKGLQIVLTLDMINKLLLKEITKSLSLEITGGLFDVWTKPGNLKILE